MKHKFRIGAAPIERPIATGIRRIVRDERPGFAFKVIALATGLMISFATVSTPAGDAFAATAAPTANPGSPVPDEAGYKKAREQLDRLYAGLDVIGGKMDRSLFEIDALSERLGSDPAAIFRFVRDEIRYEPYTGVLRGALGALLCRAGNSLDRSLLLAALMQKAGFQVQIAGGQLTAQQAAVLVGRVFEPLKPLPNAVPSIAELAPELGRATGGDPAQLLRSAKELQDYGEKQKKDLIGYADNESSLLSTQLSQAGIDGGVISPGGQLLAEAREHYWVQYQNSGGQWVDLDSAFRDAPPGKAMTSATNTFDPNVVPDELYHHLRITLTLRTAQVVDGHDDSTDDIVLLDQELRVAEQQGKDIVVVNSPVPALNDTNPGVNVAEALAATKGYQTALQVGDQVIPGKYFDLDGKVSDTLGGPVGDVVTNAGGIGRRVGGLGGGMNSVFGGGGSSAANPTRIVGVWADYKITSPGVGGEVRSYDYRRDIVAPVQITAWSASNPDSPQQVPTKFDKPRLRQNLFWFAKVMPVTGAIVVDYPGYLAIKSFSANRAVIDRLAKAAYLAQPGDPAGSSIRPPMSNLLLAEGVTKLTNVLGATRFPTLKSYFAQPGLVAYETAIDGESKRIKRGYDIVAFAPRIVGNAANTSGENRQSATSLHLLTGILATRYEWMLATAASDASTARLPTLNATRIFTAAGAQGVPVVVLRPGVDGLKKLAATSVPESVKAELSATLTAGDDVVMPVRPVALDGRQQIAWWRLQPASGQIIGVMPGGRGQGLTEEAELGLMAVSEVVCLRDYAVYGNGEGKEFAKMMGCMAMGSTITVLGFAGVYDGYVGVELFEVFASVLAWHLMSSG